MLRRTRLVAPSAPITHGAATAPSRVAMTHAFPSGRSPVAREVTAMAPAAMAASRRVLSKSCRLITRNRGSPTASSRIRTLCP